MKLIFKTNNHFYNVIYVAKIEKLEDTKLIFTMTNNMKYVEEYKNNTTRDKVYNDFINEFVVDEDS